MYYNDEGSLEEIFNLEKKIGVNLVLSSLEPNEFKFVGNLEIVEKPRN
jgi:hypothetical protein